MVNPAYIEWIWMTKVGEEDKLVHPNNVAAHRRQGWLVKSNPAPASSVAVETEEVAEPEAAVESEAPGEPEALEELEEPSTTKAARGALTPKPRTARPKKDK